MLIEYWLKSHETEQCPLENYTLIGNICRTNCKRGGSAIYEMDLNSKPTEVVSGRNVEIDIAAE